MRLIILWVGLAFSIQNSFGAKTDEGPFNVPMPEKAIDVELTGKSPREFFAKRMANPTCRPKLVKAREVYDAAKKTFLDLKAKTPATASEAEKNTLDEVEKSAYSAREAWVAFVSECGPCTSREPDPKISDDEAWYASYGSCQLSETDKPKLKTYFDKWKDSLLHQKQYARRNGGFYHIIDLLLGDPETGVVFPDSYDVIATSPAEGALSIRGPKIFGLATGFTYYTKQIFGTTETPEGFRTFAMQGWPVLENPAGFHYPPLGDKTASGQKVKMVQKKLARVLSQWFLTDDGYLSYFTAGDFSSELSAVQTQARIIMLDTITNMAERAEANPQ